MRPVGQAQHWDGAGPDRRRNEGRHTATDVMAQTGGRMRRNTVLDRIDAGAMLRK